MTTADNGEPCRYRTQLLGRWDGVSQDRTGNPARRAICHINTDLLLLFRGKADQVTYRHDLIPPCRRCANLVDKVLPDRCSPGGRWSRMPRSLAVESAVLHILHTGENR